MKRVALILVLLFLLFFCNHASFIPSHFPDPTKTITTNKIDAATQGSNNAIDKLFLLSFKSMVFDGPTGSLASWNDSIHFCEWLGVTCSRHQRPERVIGLNLANLQLAGPLPPALTNLTFLEKLVLFNNQFHGPIPQQLGSLSRLQLLNLSKNSIEGGIPSSLANLSSLSILDLSVNKISGSIPSEIGNLSSLTYLSLSENQISGSIPPSLHGLSTITHLYLSYNQLTGAIPASLGKLSRIENLSFLDNNLSATIPPSIWNLSSLTVLHVAMNRLSGAIPADIGQTLPNLEYLELYQNQFHGPFPDSLSNATNLRAIALANNRFRGTIPSSLGRLKYLKWLLLVDNQLEAMEPDEWRFVAALSNCSNLQFLQLDYNNLGGALPNSIANLSTKLQFLTMGNNQVSGNIPLGIGKLVSLTELDMGPNLLTGSIPASIGMLQKLHYIDLDQNMLSGEIPSSLGNLTRLNELYLDVNNFSGRIPASIGNCQNLNILNLDFNQLSGTIPKEVLTISTLSTGLAMSHNLLSGPIPAEVGSLRNLNIIDISLNKLSGEIPPTLGDCLLLERLDLHGNFFQGSIPLSLRTSRGLQELDLSNNNLSGKIPDFLENFPYLHYLNLSYNEFEGEVPRNGIFKNLSLFSVAGNSKLCGGNLQLHLPVCPSQDQKSGHHWPQLAVVVSIASAFVFLFLLVGSVTCRYWMRKSLGNSEAIVPMKEQFVKISYAELVRATDGFSTSNLIGMGSFGTVYKGILDDDRMKVVAVKVLNLHHQGASKSFTAECEALRNIRHRNLVKILTTCSSVDSIGHDFKAIVFEFMGNGSVESTLHPEANEQLTPKKLDLIQRLNIAVDVASALDYLHNHGQTPIVHCDLKPSNILLDDDMTAHVGDFGLARLLNKTVSEASENLTSSFVLKGTIGYIAPEYGVGNEASTHGDVYSYGILLLEMFTGKRPTDNTFKEGLSLRKFVELAFPERVLDIVDPCLLLEDKGKDDSGNAQETLDCVASVLRIGLLCTKELPMERMEMKVVTDELHVIKNRFFEDESQGNIEKKNEDW